MILVLTAVVFFALFFDFELLMGLFNIGLWFIVGSIIGGFYTFWQIGQLIGIS